jgi:hypothetical protein
LGDGLQVEKKENFRILGIDERTQMHGITIDLLNKN